VIYIQWRSKVSLFTLPPKKAQPLIRETKFLPTKNNYFWPETFFPCGHQHSDTETTFQSSAKSFRPLLNKGSPIFEGSANFDLGCTYRRDCEKRLRLLLATVTSSTCSCAFQINKQSLLLRIKVKKRSWKLAAIHVRLYYFLHITQNTFLRKDRPFAGFPSWIWQRLAGVVYLWHGQNLSPPRLFEVCSATAIQICSNFVWSRSDL